MSNADLPEPPWSSRRAKARRPALTREAITSVALGVIDADGLDALSMRRVAQELGVQASALYTHVSGKAELLQLVIDQVAGEIRVPEPDAERWQEQVKDVMRELYRLLLSHHDLAGASIANIPTGGNVVAFTDRLLAILIAGGLPRRVVGFAADLLPQYVTISAYEAALWSSHGPEYMQRVDEYYRSLPAARFPVLVDLMDEVMGGDDDGFDRFEFGLDVIVRGLAAQASP